MQVQTVIIKRVVTRQRLCAQPTKQMSPSIVRLIIQKIRIVQIIIIIIMFMYNFKVWAYIALVFKIV